MSLLSRRPVAAALFAVIIAFGCGPSVKVVGGPAPGLSSSAFLTTAATAMVIEVTPTPNHDPTPGALELLMTRAQEHCNKPDGITLQVDPEVPAPPFQSPHMWTFAELSAFEAQSVKLHSVVGKSVLNILYVEGGYAPNPAAIAISYTDHSIAFFKDMLSPGGPEASALVHELGHQMGLVNGTTKQIFPHEDPAHPLHDIDPSCVMYFSLDPQSESAPTDYCQHCKDDLKLAGGR